MKLLRVVPLLLLMVSFKTRAQITLDFSVSQSPSVLTVNAGSNKTITNGQQALLGGSPSVTGGTSPYTYTWTPESGLNQANVPNPTATPTKTTVYTMTVTDSKGCTNSKNVTITLDGVPSSIMNGYISSVKLFPNPTGGTFYISSDLISGEAFHLQVFNPQGISVYEDLLYTSNGRLDAQIDLPEEVKGLLMIKLSGDDQQVVSKIVVE